jgi:hypothetical protein
MIDRQQTLKHGMAVGFIGYLAVALFYSVFDFAASRGAFYTVNLLGKAVFRSLRDPAVLVFPIALDWNAIFLYNALHFAVAMGIGIFVTWLIAMAEENPSRRSVIKYFVAAGFFATIIVVATLTKPIRPLLPMWSVIGANGLATLLAGWYLLRKRPGLWSWLSLETA